METFTVYKAGPIPGYIIDTFSRRDWADECVAHQEADGIRCLILDRNRARVYESPRDLPARKPIGDLKIEARSVYGETRFYPINDAAECAAQLAGTKTLTPLALGILRRMGWRIVVDGDASVLHMLRGVDAVKLEG